MKKLFLAILLGISIALGGCAGMTKNTGTVSTIPNMQYEDIAFFGDKGIVYKVPLFIGASEGKWQSDITRITTNLVSVNFYSVDGTEYAVYVINKTKLTILTLSYMRKGLDGEVNKEVYYIYDGKPYPVEVNKEIFAKYLTELTAQESI